MSLSNIDKLIALDQEAPREPEAILEDLEGLGNETDIGRVTRLATELATALAPLDPMTVEASRERFLRATKGHLRAPARFFDTALADAKTSEGARDATGQGQLLQFEEPEPWPEPVDGAELLTELSNTFRRFIILKPPQLTALALWVVNSYVFDAAWITPRLAITSPEKRCGKTLVLTVLRYLVAKPLMTANATPASIYRAIESVRPTLLIDEADTFLHGRDELRGILNSGHQRDGTVLRTVGDDHEPRAFSTFSPCAIAMIGQLPDTLADRSVTIRMIRKRSEEIAERLRLDRLGHFEPLRRRLARWGIDARALLMAAEPEVPDELNDRAADNWRPLLAIADSVGAIWPESARKAAIEISAKKDKDTSDRVQLLSDLRSIFARKGASKIASGDLVAELVVMEDRPWPEWKVGRPLTPRQMAVLLKPFGIQPTSLRIGSAVRRGYALEMFEDTFTRYLPPPIRNIRNIALESEVYEESRSVTHPYTVTDPRGDQGPEPMRVSGDVTDPNSDVGPDLPREVIEL